MGILLLAMRFPGIPSKATRLIICKDDKPRPSRSWMLCRNKLAISQESPEPDNQSSAKRARMHCARIGRGFAAIAGPPSSQVAPRCNKYGRLVAALMATCCSIFIIPIHVVGQGLTDEPSLEPVMPNRIAPFPSISPLPIQCIEENSLSSMEGVADPATRRLFQARRKEAHDTCLKQKRQLELQEARDRVAQWRYYGSVRISWASWKKTPGSEIRTGRGISRCWFDLENPAIINDGGFESVEFQWARCPSDFTDIEALIAVDCQLMKTRISLKTWDNSWSKWRVPAQGSPEERLVLDLCRNAIR